MEKNERALRNLEKMSHLLDSRFKVPGTNFRFGIDPIISLVPGAGDIASFVVSGILILNMARYGASSKLVVLMVGNVVLDTVIGSIPIIGTLFDFAYKANDRNMRMMRQYYEEEKHSGSAKKVLLVAAIAILVAFILLVVLAFYIIAAAIKALG